MSDWRWGRIAYTQARARSIINHSVSLYSIDHIERERATKRESKKERRIDLYSHWLRPTGVDFLFGQCLFRWWILIEASFFFCSCFDWQVSVYEIFEERKLFFFEWLIVLLIILMEFDQQSFILLSINCKSFFLLLFFYS